MKKIVSLILCLVLAFCTAGCSKEEETPSEPSGENNPEEIVIESDLSIVIYDRDGDSEYWDAVVASFEESNPGVKVDMYIGDDAAIEVRDRILAGNSPDFVFLPSDEESGVTEALIKDRAMCDISDLEQVIDSLTLSGSVKNSKCQPYDNGKTYLAPLFFNEKGLIFNRTLLDSYGWSMPKNWNEFCDLAQKASDANIPLFSYAGSSPDEFTDMFVASVVSSLGIDGTNDLLSCDSEKWKDNSAVNSFAEYLGKITKLVATGSSTKSKEDVKSLLKDGNVICISGTSEDYVSLCEDNKTSYKFGFCCYPALTGNEQTAVIDFSEMYIPVEASNVSMAKKFLVYQYSDAATELACQYLKESAPVRNIASQAGVLGNDNPLSEVYKTLGSSAIASSFIEKSGSNGSLADEFSSLCVSVFKGNVTSSDFLTKMLEYLKDF